MPSAALLVQNTRTSGNQINHWVLNPKRFENKIQFSRTAKPLWNKQFHKTKRHTQIDNAYRDAIHVKWSDKASRIKYLRYVKTRNLNKKVQKSATDILLKIEAKPPNNRSKTMVQRVAANNSRDYNKEQNSIEPLNSTKIRLRQYETFCMFCGTDVSRTHVQETSLHSTEALSVSMKPSMNSGIVLILRVSVLVFFKYSSFKMLDFHRFWNSIL